MNRDLRDFKQVFLDAAVGLLVVIPTLFLVWGVLYLMIHYTNYVLGVVAAGFVLVVSLAIGNLIRYKAEKETQ